MSIPVIASLNGVTPGGWIEYAELMRQAGADAIELNIAFLQRAGKFREASVRSGCRRSCAVQPHRGSRGLPSLVLSRPEELLLRLHCVAILYGHVEADLGVTGGMHSAQDVVKCMMAGARVACMTSALLRNGAEHAARVLGALNTWLDDHEYASVSEMCGSMSYNAVPDPTTYERGNYMKVLGSYTL